MTCNHYKLMILKPITLLTVAEWSATVHHYHCCPPCARWMSNRKECHLTDAEFAICHDLMVKSISDPETDYCERDEVKL